jgi:hypothetical protein
LSELNIGDIAAIIAAITGVITVYLALKPAKPDFSYQRVQTFVNEPVLSRTAIVISAPNPKPLSECTVYYNGKALIWNLKDPKITSCVISLGGSEQFYVPLNEENDNANVIIKNGGTTLKKLKFWQIPRKE